MVSVVLIPVCTILAGLLYTQEGQGYRQVTPSHTGTPPTPPPTQALHPAPPHTTRYAVVRICMLGISTVP
jgi:hypothetical protein